MRALLRLLASLDLTVLCGVWLHCNFSVYKESNLTKPKAGTQLEEKKEHLCYERMTAHRNRGSEDFCPRAVGSVIMKFRKFQANAFAAS